MLTSAPRRFGAALLLACAVAAGQGCSPPDAPASKPTDRPSAPPAGAAALPAAALPLRAAAFSADRAWRHLSALCAIGPRANGTSGQARGLAYMRAHLESTGASVRLLPFTYRIPEEVETRSFTNVVAEFGPRDDGWVLIGAHHDTRSFSDEDPNPANRNTPIPGANDGGSGVAVLLEIASVLAEHPPEHGVVLAFFDGEDMGHRGTPHYFLGSKDMAARFDELFPGPRPLAAIVVDMVGDSDLRFVREQAANAQARVLNDHVWQVGTRQRAAAFAPSGTIGVLDDHRELLGIGIPSALLIDFTYPPWHTQEDTLDKCAPESLALTGRVVLESFVDSPPRVH